MDALRELEKRSIYILREAYAEFKKPAESDPKRKQLELNCNTSET